MSEEAGIVIAISLSSIALALLLSVEPSLREIAKQLKRIADSQKGPDE